MISLSSRKTFDELVDQEAKRLAKVLLEDQLARRDLPLPKDSQLDFHIEKLLEVNPTIREDARKRVEAQKDAYTESLQAIGLDLTAVEGLDL